MPSTLLTLQPIPQPGTAWKSMQYPKASVPSSCEGREQEEEPENRGGGEREKGRDGGEGRRESSPNHELRGKGGMGSRIAGKGKEINY